MKFVFGYSKTIQSKLFTGFGLLIASNVVLGGIGLSGLEVVKSTSARMDTLVKSTANIMSASSDLEAVGRTALRVAYDNETAARKQFNDALEKATSSLTETASTAVSEQRKSVYKATIAGIAAASTKANALFATVDAKEAEAATLLTTGEELLSAVLRLTEQLQSDAKVDIKPQVSTLKLLLSELRIVNWRGQAAFDARAARVIDAAGLKVKDALVELSKLDFASNSADDFTTTISTLEKYLALSKSVNAKVVLARNLFRDEIAPSIGNLQEDLTTAETQLRGESEASRAELFDTITKMQLLDASLMSLALAFGCVVSFLLARAISKPIKGMTHAMTTLASGRLEG